MVQDDSEPVDSLCGSPDQFGVWYGIETAPKDGTRVILVEADQPTEACIGWWMEGYWRDYGDIGCNGFEDYAPTHWMPLPYPPCFGDPHSEPTSDPLE